MYALCGAVRGLELASEDRYLAALEGLVRALDVGTARSARELIVQ